MLRNIPSIVVFHVTPQENVARIQYAGIDPRFSKGKMMVSWYVSKRYIEWAVIHCSVQHHVYPDEMAVISVLADGKDLVSFFTPGRYYSNVIQKAETVTPAMFFLHTLGQGDNYDNE